MKKEFKRDLQALDQIFHFVTGFCDSNRLDKDTHYMIDLVLEELFTNALKYNPGNARDICIELDRSAEQLTISMTEYDVESFDLNSKRVYDLNASLQDRPVGKLGIHFIKKMLDNVQHQYKDRENKIILTKRLNGKNA
jgi:serine/threonine-protein kinase RsbW